MEHNEDDWPLCAARGAALLDVARPGWHDEIDTNTLDINSATRCVLGQLYGYWTEGLFHLMAKRQQVPEMGIYACGFVGDPHQLRRAWLAEINHRRNASNNRSHDKETAHAA